MLTPAIIPAPTDSATLAAPKPIEEGTSVTPEPEPSTARALQDRTDKSVSTIEKLLSLVPADKQSEAGGLLVKCLEEARSESTVPRAPTSLRLGNGTRYRSRNDRAPVSSQASRF